MSTRALRPGEPTPRLEVETVGGERWVLSEQSPEHFTMVVFYRGLHCPVCKRYLQSLEGMARDFRERGVGILAVSGDTRERAEQARREWELSEVPVGYGQSVESMREWGLWVSHAIKDEEPELFGEPGLFLVRPDGTLYYAAVQSMPFARPPFRELIGAIDFALKNDYPARGEA